MERSKDSDPRPWEGVDIRLAVGEPKGESPIKLICSRHKDRIGTEDDTGSLCVYRANLHCFGCGFHIKRRYNALAFLLGYWDGLGSESSWWAYEAAKRVMARLDEFKSGRLAPARMFVPPPVSPIDVEAFHQYLMRYGPLERLREERGLSLESIRRFRLGYTGTHFSIPVRGLDGAYTSIRYRADSRVLDTNEKDFRKYDGTWGHNQPALYPLQAVRGLSHLEELWITEGEYDALASIQAGSITLTVTNGATNLPKLPEMVAALLPSLKVSRWIVATDQDNAGEDAANKLINSLPGPAVRARWGWGKDLTEYYATGGSRKGIVYDR